MSRYTAPIQTAAFKVGDKLKPAHFGHEDFDAKFKAWRERRGIGVESFNRTRRKPSRTK